MFALETISGALSTMILLILEEWALVASVRLAFLILLTGMKEKVTHAQ